MDDLVTWLREQIDLDEMWAGGLPDEAGQVFNGERFVDTPNRVRMLREVGAKRRILADIEQYVADDEAWDAGSPETDGLAVRVLDYLALPYADRPGYRAEWAPAAG